MKIYNVFFLSKKKKEKKKEKKERKKEKEKWKVKGERDKVIKPCMEWQMLHNTSKKEPLIYWKGRKRLITILFRS